MSVEISRRPSWPPPAFRLCPYPRSVSTRQAHRRFADEAEPGGVFVQELPDGLPAWQHGQARRDDAREISSTSARSIALDGVELTSSCVPNRCRDAYLRQLRTARLPARAHRVVAPPSATPSAHPPGRRARRADGVHEALDQSRARNWARRPSASSRATCRRAPPRGKRGVVRRGHPEAGVPMRARAAWILRPREPRRHRLTAPSSCCRSSRDVDSEWFGVNWDSGNFDSADPYAELAAIAPTR